MLKGTEITAPVPMAKPGTTGLGGFEVPSSKGGTLRSDASALNVGVLHLVPTLEVFPLLADAKTYARSHTFLILISYFILQSASSIVSSCLFCQRKTQKSRSSYSFGS